MKLITQHGKFYHEIECPNCKAWFGYVNKDTITKDSQSPFGNNWSTKTYIKCPECEDCITLKLIINGKIVDNGDHIVRRFFENTTRELC